MTQDAIRVLLVEDNPGDARLVRETLAEVRSARFDLTHVTRLDDARQSLEKEQYDAVLLDLFLEDSPRLSTLLEMPDHASRAAVIVFTGLDEEFVESFALGEGAQDYLVKGKLSAEELAASIRTAIRRHKTGNGPAATQQAR